MKYTFENQNSEIEIEIEASSYEEALRGLIQKVGSETEAAEYNFIRAE